MDAPTAVVAAAYLIALNQLVLSIQPLLLGGLARDYGLTDAQLGHVSAVYIGFITACNLTAPFWVRRVNWRVFSLVAIVASAAVLALGSALHTPSLFLAFFAVLGLLKGALGVPAFASLGDSSNPDRAYAVSAILQGITAAAVAALAAYIGPKFGVSGLFLSLAAIYASGLLAARWLPKSGRLLPATVGARERVSLTSPAALPPLVAALALALFVGGILAFWYFVERIGAARGVSASLIALTLSGTALASILTSSINAWLGGRLPTFAFIAAGTATILAGYAVLQWPGDAAFVVSNLLFALGWGFAQPAYWAVVPKVDATGRLFVAAPAASGLAGVAVGVVAGPVIEQGGYSGLLLFSAGMMIAAMAVAILAWRLKIRQDRRA